MKKLEEIAKKIRLKVIELLYRHKAAHLGSNMSSIEILVALYFKIMKPGDRFILSPGWKAAALYSILSQKGYFSWKELLRDYYQAGKKYIGLVHGEVKGVEASFGSAGHGLPVAIGMALVKKLNNEKGRIFCLMSDGEMDCGTTWEGALFAAHHELDNLFVIVDYNKFQAFGRTNEVLNLEPLSKKWKIFNWNVVEIDGHNFREIISNISGRNINKPKVLIAHTIKGKGISFAENQLDWHYLNLTKELYEKAKKEIKGHMD